MRIGIARLSIVVLALASALAGCRIELRREHPLACRLDEKPMIRDTLYFGLSIPDGGIVGDADWKTFEADVLARDFASGFTVWPSDGHWRGPDGAPVSEPGRVVVVIHADDAAAEAAIRDAVNRYRSSFRQQAVLRERGVVCVTL